MGNENDDKLVISRFLSLFVFNIRFFMLMCMFFFGYLNVMRFVFVVLYLLMMWFLNVVFVIGWYVLRIIFEVFFIIWSGIGFKFILISVLVIL